MRLKLLQKTAEPTCDLIGNKNADKITRASKTSPKNNLQTNEEEILKEKYISPESKKKRSSMTQIKGRKFSIT